MFQSLKYKFQSLKFKFQTLEHKFQSLEHKIVLYEKTFSLRGEDFFSYTRMKMRLR